MRRRTSSDFENREENRYGRHSFGKNRERDRDLADYNRQLNDNVRRNGGYNRYGYETREPDQRYGVSGRSWGEDLEGNHYARSSRDFDSGNRDQDRSFDQSMGYDRGSSYEGDFGRERSSYERPGRDGHRGFHFGRQFEHNRDRSSETPMTDYSGTGDGEYQPAGYSGMGSEGPNSPYGADYTRGQGLNQSRRQFRGKGPKNYTRSDDRIREDVCQRLMDADDVDAQDIDVRVESGVVTLEGTVDSRMTKHRAEDILERLSGVSEIDNRLRIVKDSSSTTSTKSASQKSGSKNSISTQNLN